jgi:acetyl-CoA carboxylase biotin carboxylase subunit
MVTGIDLIKEQIKVAAGEHLSFKQEDVKINGHAIECRINAECPSRGFLPSPGTIENLHFPGGFGVRIDTMLYQGYTIPPNYDSLAAKVITHSHTRLEAIQKMLGALGEVVIEGIDTNTDFLYDLMNEEEYLDGNITTDFVEKVLNRK